MDNLVDLYGYIIPPEVAEDDRLLFSKDVVTANLSNFEAEFLAECMDFGDQLKRFELPASNRLVTNLAKSICLISKGKGGFQQKIIRTNTQQITQSTPDKKKEPIFGGGNK